MKATQAEAEMTHMWAAQTLRPVVLLSPVAATRKGFTDLWHQADKSRKRSLIKCVTFFTLLSVFKKNAKKHSERPLCYATQSHRALSHSIINEHKTPSVWPETSALHLPPNIPNRLHGKMETIWIKKAGAGRSFQCKWLSCHWYSSILSQHQFKENIHLLRRQKPIKH